MELKQKIKLLGEQKIFGVNKLIRIGGSYGVTLPKIWVDFHCTEIDGEYYCRLEVNEDTLIFSPINIGDIEAVRIKEKQK